MGGARALIASLGASISLVAGAALSLLFVSFLFAYDGLGGAADEPTTHAAVRVDARPSLTPRASVDDARGAAPIVIRTPVARPARDEVVREPAPKIVRESATGVETSRAPDVSGVPQLGPAPDSRPATSDAGASRPATGDGVRDLGDSVSATVGETGEAAGNATAPLGPPVSQAVQEILNVVQSLLEGATAGLAGTLDTALPRR